MKIFLFAAAGAMALALPAAPAAADPPPWAPAHGYHKVKGQKYDRHGRYYEPRRVTRADRVWRGNDGRYYCRRSNGTTGLIIGAAGGALAGRAIDGGRDRTTGTVVGAAIGGLLGREIDRGQLRCR